MVNGRQQLSYEELLQDDPVGMTALDRALEGATMEEKARVRGLLMSQGIEADHEFYLIFASFGYLRILIEDVPQSWRALFSDIHRELNQWAAQNLTSLENLKLHTQTSTELIQSLRQLLTSIRASDDRSSRILLTLSTLELKLKRIETNSTALSNSSSQTLAKVNRLEEGLGSIESQLKDLVDARTWISVFNVAVGVISVGLLMGGGIALTRRLDTQAQVIRRQSAEIGWLLEKANRAECANGIKPPSDPQCRQFQ